MSVLDKGENTRKVGQAGTEEPPQAVNRATLVPNVEDTKTQC